MFKIADGRDHLYQWDSDVKLVVSEEIAAGIDEVHFTAKYSRECLTVKIARDDTGAYVMVPNILLQESYDIIVYAFCCTDKATKHVHEITVLARPKPADYVYTETEVYSIKIVVDNALLDAKNSGIFDGVSPTVEVQTIENGSRVIITDRDGVRSFDLSNGKDGVSVSHIWDGTKLVVTSASGTTSADLKGDKGDTYVLTDSDIEELSSRFIAPVEKSADDAAQSARAALESETKAHESELNAIAAKDSAETSAQDAAGSAWSAENAAERASTRAEEAKKAAENAVLSEQNAKTSETNAAKSAEEAKKAAENAGGGMGGADWNAAEGDPGHVLNRTHWVDGETVHKLPGKFLPDGVPYVEESAFLNEAEVTFVDMDGMMGAMFTPNAAIGVGAYTVNWNGVAYPVNAIYADGLVLMGNMSALGGDDTGEPFLILTNGGELVVVPLDGSESAVISIFGLLATPIHRDCIPDLVTLDLVSLGVSTLKTDEVATVTVDDSTIRLLTSAEKNGVIKLSLCYELKGFNLFTNTIGDYTDMGTDTVIATICKYSGTYRITTILSNNIVVCEIRHNTLNIIARMLKTSQIIS